MMIICLSICNRINKPALKPVMVYCLTRLLKLTIVVIRLFRFAITVCRAYFAVATCKNSHQHKDDQKSEYCNLFHVHSHLIPDFVFQQPQVNLPVRKKQKLPAE